jgi:hypothetical protein
MSAAGRGFGTREAGVSAVSEKKPELIYFPAVRRFCPVCGKVSYSLSGEHPQCALARSDAAFKAKQKKRDQPKRVGLTNR